MIEMKLLPTFCLTQENSSEGRTYLTPDGRYPSVTTVLGQVLDKSYLEVWKQRVGEERAGKVMRRACVRGSLIHRLMEHYVQGDPEPEKSLLYVHKLIYRQLKRILDDHLEIVHGIEYATWSNYLRVAGMSDLPCTFDGKKTILDFKTARRVKREEDILGYFLQATCYSLAIYERTNVLFPQIAILIAIDDENEAQLFVKNIDEFIDIVEKKIKNRNF